MFCPHSGLGQINKKRKAGVEVPRWALGGAQEQPPGRSLAVKIKGSDSSSLKGNCQNMQWIWTCNDLQGILYFEYPLPDDMKDFSGDFERVIYTHFCVK